MFNIGFLEILVLLGIGLIFLGPDEFPKIARKFLKSFYDLKKIFDDVRLEAKNLEGEVQKTISASKKSIFSKTEDTKNE